MQALNTFFEDARRYRVAKLAKAPGFMVDRRYEALLPVLEGATPMFVAATREREIRDAIAFADAQKIRIILADPYEAYKVLPLIKSHNIPVILGPTLTLPLDEDDDYDRSYTTPNDLYKAGITFCIGTFSARLSRNLPYQAAAAVSFGLPHDEAFKAITLNAAEILGVGETAGIDRRRESGGSHRDRWRPDGNHDPHHASLYQRQARQPGYAPETTLREVSGASLS